MPALCDMELKKEIDDSWLGILDGEIGEKWGGHGVLLFEIEQYTCDFESSDDGDEIGRGIYGWGSCGVQYGCTQETTICGLKGVGLNDSGLNEQDWQCIESATKQGFVLLLNLIFFSLLP